MRTNRLTNTPVTLYVAQVEKGPGADGTEVTALHGVHKGRAWRLTMAEAVLACKSGRYIFYVEHEGERRKLAVAPGGSRLEGAARAEGDVLQRLPVVPQALAA